MIDYKKHVIQLSQIVKQTATLDYDTFVSSYLPDYLNDGLPVEKTDEVWQALIKSEDFFNNNFLINEEVTHKDFSGEIYDILDDICYTEEIIIPVLEPKKLKISDTHEVTVHPIESKEFMGDVGIKTFHFNKGERIFTKSNVEKMKSAEKFLCFHFNSEVQKMKCLKELHEMKLLNDDIYENKKDLIVIVKK